MVSVPTPEEFISSFPHSDIAKVQGEPSYENIVEIRNQLKINAASIPSNRGGGAHGCLGLVLSDAVYATISAQPFTLPAYPGAQPNMPNNPTQAAINQLAREHNENIREWREFTNVHNALKKQLASACDPIWFKAIYNRNTGFTNITLREMLHFLLTSCGQITPNDLLDNETRIKTPWNPAEPFEFLVEQIEDCQECADAGQQAFTAAQILTIACALVFNTGLFFDECKKWNNKPAADKTWNNFKTHFRQAYQDSRLQQKTSQQAGFHGANLIQEHASTETAEALAHLATAASADRQALANMTQTIDRLTIQLAAKDDEIASLKARLSNNNRRPPMKDNGNYCWSHGYRVGRNHTSQTCENPKEGHQRTATRANTMGGSDIGKPTS